jgi:hypothetical protein
LAVPLVGLHLGDRGVTSIMINRLVLRLRGTAARGDRIRACVAGLDQDDLNAE